MDATQWTGSPRCDIPCDRLELPLLLVASADLASCYGNTSVWHFPTRRQRKHGSCRHSAVMHLRPVEAQTCYAAAFRCTFVFCVSVCHTPYGTINPYRVVTIVCDVDASNLVASTLCTLKVVRNVKPHSVLLIINTACVSPLSPHTLQDLHACASATSVML